MTIRTISITAAAAALAAAPIAAQAQSATYERSSATVSEEENLSGDLARLGIILLIGAAGMAFLLLTADDEDDDLTLSP